MASDDQYTALGPTQIGFQTHGANIQVGADITGIDAGVRGQSDFGYGVEARGAAGGVHGIGAARPSFRGPTGVGVLGESIDDNGVRGVSTQNDGVAGIAAALGKSGVFGFNSHPNQPDPGHGQPRAAQVGFGVFGRCDLVGGAGVGGRNEGRDPVTGVGGAGVIGTSHAGDGVVGGSESAGKSGVFGFNSHGEGAAFGVSGTTTSPDGAGINGFSDHGYGGQFAGTRAPLRLLPAPTHGHPNSGHHQIGEFFVDAAGELYFCKESGSPGKWFKVHLTAV